MRLISWNCQGAFRKKAGFILAQRPDILVGIAAAFFLQRNKKKPYHLDYCFTSKDWCDKVQQVSVGNFRSWIKHSDHLPLVIDFNL